MIASERISSKDFLEKINSGNLKPESIVFGKVKKSDKDSEILFAFKGDKSSTWIRVPGSMIEHVHLIKSFTCEGEKVALVKMHLNAPSDPEAKVYNELLSALQAKVMRWYMKKMMMGESGSGETKNKTEEPCGKKTSCEWNYKK